MARFRVVEEEDAPAAIRTIYADIRREFGMVPMEAGFSQAEILELVAVADLAVCLNTYADALALPPDDFSGIGENKV